MTYGMKIGLRKLRVSGLPAGENCMVLHTLVFEYQCVTDRQSVTISITNTCSA